jgi:hypothetical protein
MRTVRFESDIKDVEGETKRWMKPTSTEPHLFKLSLAD